MNWNIKYDRINLDNDIINPSKYGVFLGDELPMPYGGISAEDERNAIVEAISYIRELMESNCLKCRKRGYTLTIYDSADDSPIEKYCNFICMIQGKEEE